MRPLLTIIALLPTLVFGQGIMTLEPEMGKVVDKSVRGEIEQLEREELCEDFWKGMPTGRIDRSALTEAQQEMLDSCSADLPAYWSIHGLGCSWYCGGGQDSITASSELKPSKFTTYSASNAHDLSYKTAWVEGVEGHGIGQFLTYHVQPTNPRITEIIVVNGYVKSDKLWYENSRVKRLRMFIDDKPYAELHLEDSKAEQHFKVEPIGNGNRGDWEALKKLPVWTMKFEIVEVYPGAKYEDTALTEIYFDGIDVH